jgi:hypothetical protein
MGRVAKATGLAGAEALEPSGLHPSDGIPRAGSLLDRLRATEHRGRYAHGGGSIGSDGKGTFYGGGKIMEPRNPDGGQAADLIELLARTLASICGVGAGTRRTIDDALKAIAKARGEHD